ncbi:MAG: putative sugar nucleotidyl transferase [Balneolales bacterium]
MILFEDEDHKHFYPLALTRPMDEQRIGVLTIREKWLHYLQEAKYFRTVRKDLEPFYNTPLDKQEGDELWINSRFLPDEEVIKKILTLKRGTGLSSSGIPVAVRMSSQESRHLIKQEYPDFQGIPLEPVSSGFLLTRVWELFERNGIEIRKDYELLGRTQTSNETNTEHSILVNPGNISFGENVKIDAGVILDASEGPIYIGSGVQIMSGSVIKGPVSIGEESIIKMGAKIYPDTTIGPVCKVGGEVKCVIIQGFSNKAHDGFLGNSLIGEWCNIGADTNSSNLKNNYKSIYMTNWMTGEPYETGIKTCGTIMGDHSKTSINSMLGTGTICGVACNLLGSGFNPKLIPSFSWVGDDGVLVHEFDKAMETAVRVMARRNVKMSDAYRQMMQTIYENR